MGLPNFWTYWISTFLLIAFPVAFLCLLFGLVKAGQLLIGLILLVIVASLLAGQWRGES